MYKYDVPKEIIDFLREVFCIYEIRGRIGKENGISFEIRTREPSNHIPHLHAKYGEYSISVALDDVRVLSGNLPPKQEKMAIEWVKNHKDTCISEWSQVHINYISTMTETGLNLN